MGSGPLRCPARASAKSDRVVGQRNGPDPSSGGRSGPRPGRPRVGWHPPPVTRTLLTTCAHARHLRDDRDRPPRAGHGRRRDLRGIGRRAPARGAARGRPGRARARARRRLDPRQRARRARGRPAPAPARAAGRRPALARRAREPRRHPGGHAAERPRRGPQPQLPVPLGRRRAAVRHVLPRSPPRVGAGDACAAVAGRRRAARPHALLPPAHAARGAAARGGPRAGPRVRPPRRAAGPHAAALPRHRDQLAEPSRAGHHRVRGRVARRHAHSRRRRSPRPRGARDRLRPRARRSGGGAQAGDRVGPDPVRRRPQAPDARVFTPALRRRQGEARRPEGDRRALHRVDELPVRLQHVREPTRPTSSSASDPASAPTS